MVKLTEQEGPGLQGAQGKGIGWLKGLVEILV